jgi:hypothetical protein
MYDRQKNIPKALEGTCDWLFCTTKYRNWMGRAHISDHRGLLWIKGKPGAGKSTLMKEAARRETEASKEAKRATRKTTVAAFFFNARGTQPLENTPLGLYRSLLHQVLQKDLVALNHFSRVYVTARPVEIALKWHEEDLQEILLRCFASQDSPPSTIFIDAMDECDEEEVRELLRFFRNMTEAAYRAGAVLNICMSSRHYPNISMEGCPEVVVEHFNREDILLYINAEARSNSLIRGLKDDLFKKSDGVFLWVVLVVAILLKSGHGRSLKWLRQKLDEIPAQLDTLFRKIFDHVDPEDGYRAVRLMYIMLFDRRPLGLDEIHRALAFSGQAYPSIAAWKDSVDFLENAAQKHAMVIDLSRGLLEPKESSQQERQADDAEQDVKTEIDLRETTTYQFIHETVREFFLSGEGFKLLGSYSDNTAGTGHSVLSIACVNYLNTPEIAILASAGALSRDHPEKQGFLSYVISYLFGHIESAEKSGTSQQGALETIQNAGLVTRLKQLLSSLCGVSQGASLLYAAVELRLVHTTTRLLSMGYDVNETSEATKRYPLLACLCKKQQSDPVEMLEMLRLLLAYKADISVTTKGKQTALHLAARTYNRIVCEIIEHKPDMNAQDWFGETPLHEASRNTDDSDQIIHTLVQHGANINAIDDEGNTALHRAGYVQNSKAFKALLAAGADSFIQNNIGDYALDDSQKWAGEYEDSISN